MVSENIYYKYFVILCINKDIYDYSKCYSLLFYKIDISCSIEQALKLQTIFR